MQKQLRDGLILRTLSEGIATDRERLPQFYADVNGADSSELGKNRLKIWTNDLIEGHVTVTPDDIFMVVDPAHDDRIVAATLLIPQTWRYEGIPIPVGRPELVGTLPEYRNRGLVRSLFEAVHERSAALGHELQAITGIPYFYRQFGYTMAVALDDMYAQVILHAVKDAAPDVQPQFTLRPAVQEDIPAIAAFYDTMARERLLTEYRSAAEWHYEIFGRDPESSQRMAYLMIANRAGESVGYLELYGLLGASSKYAVDCNAYVVGANASYVETFDDVIGGIKAWSIAQYGECPALLLFNTGIHESLDTLIRRTSGGHVGKNLYSYLWYLRVPDPIAFFRRIAPVLERRLEGSGAQGYTGEFKIGFYEPAGVRLKFERGRIAEITATNGRDDHDIAYPWHMMWNVVFGHHSFDDLYMLHPDDDIPGKTVVLLDTLFPKKKSWLKGMI